MLNSNLNFFKFLKLIEDVFSHPINIYKSQGVLDDQNNEELDEKLNAMNPVITAKKGSPAGRAKSAVEIQDKEIKKHCLKSVDLNIQRRSHS
jgi:hypothetical protein